MENEKAGTTESKEYHEAMTVFYKRHLCLLQPWPAELHRSFECIEKDPTVYLTMRANP